MYNIEIPTTINGIIAIFYQFGFWDIKKTKGTALWTRGRKFFYFIYFLLISISIGMGAFISTDKDEFIFSAVCFNAVVVQLRRMSYIIWKKNDILSLVHHIGNHSTNNHEEFIVVKNKLQRFVKFTQYFLLILAIDVTLNLILPLASSEKSLMINIGFPFDWKRSTVGFWIAQVYIEGGIFLSFVCGLFTVILWYIMLNFAKKYEMLGNQFKNMGAIGEFGTEGQKVKVWIKQQEKLFLRDFIAAIESHQRITEFIDRFGYTFSDLFFLQIATSSMCICGSAYTIAFSSHENLVRDGTYCLLIIYCLADIFVVMYLANEIKLYSDRLSYCLFESNWVEQTQLCKKYILIMSTLLKQPQEFIIAKLYPLNLETFTLIVNRAYSMYNILLTLRK